MIHVDTDADFDPPLLHQNIVFDNVKFYSLYYIVLYSKEAYYTRGNPLYFKGGRITV